MKERKNSIYDKTQLKKIDKKEYFSKNNMTPQRFKILPMAAIWDLVMLINQQTLKINVGLQPLVPVIEAKGAWQ